MRTRLTKTCPAARAARRRYRRRSPGFTMIEMLTVIAIIALLAGIIFPVFATVRENARRTQCISNMREMARAVKQYNLDNREYPEYLFGPALDAQGLRMTAPGTAGHSMRDIQGLLASTDSNNQVATNAKREYAKSLYPEYINDLNMFHCPNNSAVTRVDDRTAVVAQRIEERRDDYNDPPSPLSVVRPVGYYPYDSYDANKRIVNFDDGTLSNEYLARYSKLWMPIAEDPTTLDTNTQLPHYKRQLHFRSPGDDTFVSACTWHAPKGKVIILWLSGTAKVLDLKKMVSLRVQPGSSQPDADMWLVRPGD